MAYAELVEEGVWNVMISDIPLPEHEAWMGSMVDQTFRPPAQEGIHFMWDGASGAEYVLQGTAHETEDGLTVAYRISVDKR